MLPISATLLAAQRSARARPYVHAEFSDYHGDTSRLRYSRLYTGAEGEYYTAAAVAADGSLIRARIDPATKVLYTQRVADPGPSSTFSAWSSHGTVSASGAIALASGAGVVSLFYVDADTVTLRAKDSADNGATYAPATTVATAASAITYLAGAAGAGASAGETVLFWTVGAVVWRSRFAAGGWSARAAWSNTAASITGLACAHFLDWAVVVCGTAIGTGDAKVWTAAYGDGYALATNTWGTLVELTTATGASGVSFRSPALAMLHHRRLFFVEKYSGTQAYARLQWSVMHSLEPFTSDVWREPAAFDYTGDYGLAAAAGSSSLWLAATAGVWSGALNQDPQLDVSADVIEAQVDRDGAAGRARLVLRNDSKIGGAGRYAGYGTGALSPIRRGSRLQLSPGYYTSAGREYCPGDTYWVESIEQTTGADASLIVHARDAWAQLEAWRARRQFIWPAGTQNIGNILRFICSRAGLGYNSITFSPSFGTLAPGFTLSPGDNGRTAVLSLLAMVPDQAFMRSSALVTRYVQPDDAAVYAYGAAHAIRGARYLDEGPEVNRARVLGAGVFNEGFDFAEIEAVGERIAQVSDLNLSTAAQASDRAAARLRSAALDGRRDELHVAGVNCAQEVLDCIEVTDPQAGLTAAKRLVRGLSWRYQSKAPNPRYDMTLRLGSP